MSSYSGPIDRKAHSNLSHPGMARALLGDDGRGYELARRLDFCGAWRAWLGESAYASFAPSLSSPSAWDSFLSPANPNVRLHLRARALLYDKASVALATRHAPPSDHSALAPSYLQLHGDDVYYSLEDAGRDGDDAATAQAQSGLPSSPSKSSGGSRIKSSNAGARAVESENENSIQKDKHDSLQDLWYDKFIEKYRSSRHLKFPFADCNSMKRTPEGMSSYLKLITLQKRRRVGFKDDESMTVENGTIRQLEKMEDDIFVIPELMFPFNCVPDNTILPPAESESPQKLEFYGVLDSLPHLITPSRTVIERLGIRPEYLKVEFGRSKYRGKKGSEATRESLSSDQVLQLAHRVVAQALVNAGLDGGSDISIQILSQFLGSYICKLGRNLKILTDSYRMQFTSTELINMFLKTIGCGNLGALSDYLKKITRNLPHQSQQAHSLHGQQEIHHLPTHQQQIQRPMLSQQNTHRPQNMVFQQQVQMQQQQLQFLQQQHIQMQMQQQQQQQIHLQKQQQMQQQQHQQQKQQQLQMQMQQQHQQMQQQKQQIQMQQQQQQQLQVMQQQQQQQPQQQLQTQQQQMLNQSQQMQSQPQMQLHQQQMQSPPQQLLMHPQQQHLLQQQQLQMLLRQRQISAARDSAMAEQEQPGAEVKVDNIPDHTTDGSFNAVNRHQLQFRNQQLGGSTSHVSQPGKQFKQFTVQSPQLQTQGNFSVRTPPVKVEGFQELMGGGDGAALRQDSEERKLTSPSK